MLKYQRKQMGNCVGVAKTCLHHKTTNITGYIVFAFFLSTYCEAFRLALYQLDQT